MRALMVLALACFALVACTEAQRYAMDVSRRAQASLAPLRVCQVRMEGDPQFARVYQKLAVSTADDPFREPTAAQLSDSETISDGDKSLYLAWFGDLQTCATPTMEELGRLAPEYEIYFANAQADQADLINEFLVNRHTFGDANAAISAFKARVKIAAKDAGTKLKARIEAWGREEREQTAENVAFLTGYVAVAVATRGRMSITHLANRQSALVRAQANHLRMHPSLTLAHRVRVIQCDGIVHTLRCTLR